MSTPLSRARAASRFAPLALSAFAAVAAPAAAQEPGWYFGLGGYYVIQNDSDGTSLVPGTQGGLGLPGSPDCLLGEVLGIGCIGDVISGADPTQPQRLPTEITFKDGWAAETTLGYRYENGLRPELSFAYAENDWDEVTLTAADGTRSTSESSNTLEVMRLMGNVWYDFSAGTWLRPYLGGGVGYQQVKISGDIDEDDGILAYQAGGGLGFPLSERLLVSLDYRFVGGDDPEYDTADGGELSMEYSSHNIGLGLRYTFASTAQPEPEPEPQVVEPAPAPEPEILCPDTPAGVPVDEHNCPLDRDGDGVPDHLDECPNSPPGAQVLPNGCALEGDCRTPRPGEQVDPNGCAIEQSFVLRGVNFEFDSARLTPEALEILDGVAETLQAYPNVRVDVEGHTDYIGTDAYNQGLSERRAIAVKDYLVEKGIEADRMNPVGYGESQPIDTNETVEGREKNRRVELDVVE
ncbi:MAG: OmpA family protein [Pseudomonadota bacterium]